jgi:hypothetical protein
LSATTMADLKAIAEAINQNAHRLAELDQTACERTANVDSSEKMDSISGRDRRRCGGGVGERENDGWWEPWKWKVWEVVGVVGVAGAVGAGEVVG